MYYDQAPEKQFSYFYNMPEFCSEVLYNPVYIDARLSDVGIEQCKNAQGNEELKKVDVVLVSPLNRALETAKIAFGDLGVPIVVHSELSESFRYGCDLSDPIEDKKKEFPNFDFSNMKDFGEGWEIKKNLSERNQLLYNKFVENHQKDDLK